MLSDFRQAIDGAARVVKELRAENAALRRRNEELRAEIRRLGERPCHYCDVVGHHSEDCPVLLREVAGG